MFDINNKEKLMQAYIDGELSAELAVSFEKELQNDINLQKEYEEQLLLHSLLQDISACDVEPPADFVACVRQRIEAEEASSSTVKKVFPWRFAAPAFAAAALLLAFGISGIKPEAPVINQPVTTAAPEKTTVPEETTVAATTVPEEKTGVVAETTIVIEEKTTVAEQTTAITAPATVIAPVEPATTAPQQSVPVIEPPTAPEVTAPVVEPTTAVVPEKTTAVEPEKTSIAAPEPVTKPEPEQPTTAPEKPPVVEPPQTAPEEIIPPVEQPDEEITQGKVPMPAPATDTVILGNNISVMRFSVAEGDAFALFRNEASEIQFYAEHDDEIALCTVMDTVAGMEILENSDIALVEESTACEDFVIEFSPDGTQLAGNMAGEEGGLWISDNSDSAPAHKLSEISGGKILEWAPNSGKLVFSAADGSLYVAYPAEGIVVQICEQPVYSVLWLSDSCGIFFETVDENGYHVICKAVLP